MLRWLMTTFKLSVFSIGVLVTGARIRVGEVTLSTWVNERVKGYEKRSELQEWKSQWLSLFSKTKHGRESDQEELKKVLSRR